MKGPSKEEIKSKLKLIHQRRDQYRTEGEQHKFTVPKKLSEAEELIQLHQQNIRLKEMANEVVNKMAKFVNQTTVLSMKREKKPQPKKEPQNEVVVQKTQELDSYLQQI